MMTGGWIGLVWLMAGIGQVQVPTAVDARLVVESFAAEPVIVTPTGIAVDRTGRVLVIESHTHFRPEGYTGPPADRLRWLIDDDADGRADRATTFFEGSKYTMGVAFDPLDPKALFVATRSELFRLRDADNNGAADGPPETLVRLETAGNYPHNGLSGFAFDASGTVYFGLGENLGASYKLIGKDGEALSGGGEGGSVFRCRPDGSKLERVATGFWNPFAQAFDTFGRLFIVDNDPDSRPPCRLVHVVPGGDYGYRFRNGRKGLHPFTAWNGELPGTLPMVAGTGEAPSGLVAYESDNLPDDYRGTILATSWGDHRIERFRLRPEGASFKATAEPIVTGGENFRPVGIAVAPDGSIYLTDWVDKSYALHGKGRVWHLRARETPSARVPKKLSHPDRPTRESSARQLAEKMVMPERRIDSIREILRLGLNFFPDPRARAALLDAVVSKAVPGDDEAYSVMMDDPSPDLRAMAVRLGPARRVENDLIATRDASPLVRAEALRRLGRPESEPVLLKVLGDPDPFTRQAAREGLKRALAPEAIVGLLKSEVAAQRLGAILALRELGGPADDVIPRALADPDLSVRFVAIRWIGEERLEKYRPALREGIATGAVTRQLFESYLAALERLDGVARDPSNEAPGENYVSALLTDPKTPPAVLRRALRVLRPDHPSLTFDRLSAFLKASDPDLRLEAVRTLGEGALPGRFDLLARLAEAPSEPVALRAEALVGLSAEADPRRGLLVALAAGPEPSLRHEALRDLRGLTLNDNERARIAQSGDAEASALLDVARPGAPLPDTEPLSTWLETLDGPGDVDSGERVFFSAKGPGCYRCHQIDGRGGRVGPDLSTTASTLSRERLVESIVAPSKEIAPQFVSWLVTRKDGTSFTGTLLDQSANGAQTYADARGALINVPPGDVEERRPQPTSIMPADTARLMTPQEFRDLLAFLRSPRPRTSDAPAPAPAPNSP